MFRRRRLFPIFALLLATATQADGMRDPMRPAGAAPAAPRALRVQSLRLEGVIGGEHRVAIINGQAVREGDVVGGVKIVEILVNGVRCERAGKSFTLTLAAATANPAVRVARSQEK
jgi:hypothetical protein